MTAKGTDRPTPDSAGAVDVSKPCLERIAFPAPQRGAQSRRGERLQDGNKKAKKKGANK